MLDICGIFWRLFIDGASSVLMKRFFFSNGLNVSSFFCTNHSRRTQIHRQHSMCVAWYDCTAVKALEKKNCLSFVLYEAIHSFLPRLPPLPRSFSLFYLWSCSEKSRRKPSCSGVLFRRTGSDMMTQMKWYHWAIRRQPQQEDRTWTLLWKRKNQQCLCQTVQSTTRSRKHTLLKM